MNGGWLIVFVTSPNYEEAEKLARGIISERLAACVNIVDNITSIYWWKNNVEKDKEVLLIIKTHMRVFKKLVEYIKNNHSYEVPEIIAMPIIAGYANYLEWIMKEVKEE